MLVELLLFIDNLVSLLLRNTCYLST